MPQDPTDAIPYNEPLPKRRQGQRRPATRAENYPPTTENETIARALQILHQPLQTSRRPEQTPPINHRSTATPLAQERNSNALFWLFLAIIFVFALVVIFTSGQIVSRSNQEKNQTTASRSSATQTARAEQPASSNSTRPRVWMDRSEYRIGESVRIYLNLDRTGYVYLYDIDAAGKVTLLFPNARTRGNRLGPGTYTLPSSTDPQPWVVAPPAGSESLYLVVTPQPLPSGSPWAPGETFRSYGYITAFIPQMKEWLQRLFPSGDWVDAQFYFKVLKSSR